MSQKLEDLRAGFAFLVRGPKHFTIKCTRDKTADAACVIGAIPSFREMRTDCPAATELVKTIGFAILDGRDPVFYSAWGRLTSWSWSHSYAEVLQLYRDTIARVEKEEAVAVDPPWMAEAVAEINRDLSEPEIAAVCAI